MKKSNFNKNKKGQMLVELLVAITIGGIFITGATLSIATMVRQNFENRGVQLASYIANNLLSGVRSLSQSNWNDVYNLQKGSANKYFLVKYATSSAIVGGEESMLYNDIASGLVGHWKFDATAGTTTYDSSGYGNNGTLVGPPTRTASSTCKVGKCLSFNGTSDYVDVGNNASLSITPEFTLAAWVKLAPNTAGLRLGILSKQRSSPHDGYSLARETNNEFVFWTMNNDSTVAVFSDTTYTDALWHYVVAVRQNGINYLYIDGVRQGATTTLAPNEVGLNVQIGTFYQGSNLFDGLIDDVRIYNRALTANEISALYNSAVYERYFYVDNVQRDNGGVGNIVSSAGIDDPSTQKLTSVAHWRNNRNLSFSAYVTRHKDNVFEQINWEGGSGVIGPSTLATTTFATSSNILATSTLTLISTTTSGYLESVIFDTQDAGGAVVNSIRWDGVLPTGASVQFQIAYSNSVSGPWTYVGSDGTSSTYFVPLGSGIAETINNINNYRYFRYKIFLSTTGVSPTVNDAIINWIY